MSPCKLYEEGGRRHFLTKRFDRLENGKKLHMQSLGAMSHLDFNQAGAHSYEQAFLVMNQLGLPANQMSEMFTRMVFNVVELPIPLVAALAHYQFATIHPYYDGNGRTARLLATLILHKSGYGLKGIYSLEEYYAQNLSGYYQALEVGESHNYYMGRAESDLTNFIAYFCKGMADSFASVRQQALQAGSRQAEDQSAWLRKLDPRERQLVAFLKHEETATTKQIAEHLVLSPRTVTALCLQWVGTGLLALQNPSKKNRSYRLSGK